ncbi:MAG: hypothetical protein HY754_07605 [Nitrospirae bacterium]|nr:hypothetical protein [Nitrospirota bacterium]
MFRKGIEKGTIFSLILGLRPPRYFASLIYFNKYLNIGKINPLKDSPLLYAI